MNNKEILKEDMIEIIMNEIHNLGGGIHIDVECEIYGTECWNGYESVEQYIVFVNEKGECFATPPDDSENYECYDPIMLDELGEDELHQILAEIYHAVNTETYIADSGKTYTYRIINSLAYASHDENPMEIGEDGYPINGDDCEFDAFVDVWDEF